MATSDSLPVTYTYTRTAVVIPTIPGTELIVSKKCTVTNAGIVCLCETKLIGDVTEKGRVYSAEHCYSLDESQAVHVRKAVQSIMLAFEEYQPNAQEVAPLDAELRIDCGPISVGAFIILHRNPAPHMETNFFVESRKGEEKITCRILEFADFEKFGMRVLQAHKA